MAQDFWSRILFQFVLLYTCTHGEGMKNGNETTRSPSVRFNRTPQREIKKFDNNVMTSGIGKTQRERSDRSNQFTIGRNIRRQINHEGRHAVKNYDFYDQSNEFEWFKGQGHNRYPYQSGTPVYSHEGYGDYEKPPDSHDVSQAMNLLEKHMTSSEALSADNMFRNNEGQRHESENDHRPMMSDHQNDNHYEGNVNEDKLDHKHDAEFPMSQNDGHEGQKQNLDIYNEHAPHEDHNIDENGYEHDTEIKYGNENRQHSEKIGLKDSENNRNNMKEGEHMTEHYKWENVKGPEMLNGNDLPLDKNHQEHREGWLPLEQHENGHVSYEGYADNNHGSHEGYGEKDHGANGGYDENRHGPLGEFGKNDQHGSDAERHESTASEMRSSYFGKEAKILEKQSGIHNKDQDNIDRGNDMHSERGASNEAQKSKLEEEYNDFPKITANPCNMKENSNTVSAHNGRSPQQQHEDLKQQEPEESHNEHDHFNHDKSYGNDERKADSENHLKIDIGYPHYQVPNTHTEAVKSQPHQGPERGGGLWGNLPGVGEQYYGENNKQKIESVKIAIDSKSKLESKDESFQSGAEMKDGEKDKTGLPFDAKMGQGANINRMQEKEGGSKNSKLTRIPVKMTTGVYDSREIFSIDGKKAHISSKPVANELKRREETHKPVHRLRRKFRKKRKQNELKVKQWHKAKKRRKRLKFVHSYSKSKNSLFKVPLHEDWTRNRRYKKTRIHKLAKFGGDADILKRHGAGGEDLAAVHGHPAISDEEARHSTPDELLDMANDLRHRAEEYDGKARELENQAEIQDHQEGYHGSISQHQHHEGPERGGNLHGEEHEGEGLHGHHTGIGPWHRPMWHGPHFNNEHGGYTEYGGHGHGGEGGEGGHDGHVIHFNTGYPYYHVPKPHSLPLVEYDKPAPPIHGLNPYEVLTSEQFHRPMLPAGHGNLPYGHNQGTFHPHSYRTEVANKRVYKNKLGSRNVEHGTVVGEIPKYDTNTKDILSDENFDSFLLK